MSKANAALAACAWLGFVVVPWPHTVGFAHDRDGERRLAHYSVCLSATAR